MVYAKILGEQVKRVFDVETSIREGYSRRYEVLVTVDENEKKIKEVKIEDVIIKNSHLRAILKVLEVLEKRGYTLKT